MISFYKIFKDKLLLNPSSLEPFGDTTSALDRLYSYGFKPKKIKGSVRKVFQISETDIHKMNKDAYQEFCKKIDHVTKVLNKKKESYEARRNS